MRPTWLTPPNVEITNTLAVEPPHTGDGIRQMITLMIFSMAGILVLLTTRKKFRRA